MSETSMKTIRIILFVCLCGITWLLPSIIHAEVIFFQDGSTIQGTVVKKSRNHVVVEAETFHLKIANQWLKNDLLPDIPPSSGTASWNPGSAYEIFQSCFVDGPPRQKHEQQIKRLAQIPCLASVFVLVILTKIDFFYTTACDSLKELCQYPQLAVPSVIISTFPSTLKIEQDDLLLIRALSKLPSPQVILFLQRLIRQSTTPAKQAALQALGTIESEASQALLLDLLREEQEPRMLAQVLLALGQQKNPQLLPVILPYLDSQDNQLLFAAYWAIQKLSGQKFPPHRWLWEKWWEERNITEQSDADNMEDVSAKDDGS